MHQMRPVQFGQLYHCLFTWPMWTVPTCVLSVDFPRQVHSPWETIPKMGLQAQWGLIGRWHACLSLGLGHCLTWTSHRFLKGIEEGIHFCVLCVSLLSCALKGFGGDWLCCHLARPTLPCLGTGLQLYKPLLALYFKMSWTLTNMVLKISSSR